MAVSIAAALPPSVQLVAATALPLEAWSSGPERWSRPRSRPAFAVARASSRHRQQSRNARKALIRPAIAFVLSDALERAIGLATTEAPRSGRQRRHCTIVFAKRKRYRMSINPPPFGIVERPPGPVADWGASGADRMGDVARPSQLPQSEGARLLRDAPRTPTNSFLITVSLRLRVELSAHVGHRAAAVLAPYHKLLYSSDAYRLAKL